VFRGVSKRKVSVRYGNKCDEVLKYESNRALKYESNRADTRTNTPRGNQRVFAEYHACRRNSIALYTKILSQFRDPSTYFKSVRRFTKSVPAVPRQGIVEKAKPGSGVYNLMFSVNLHSFPNH
jgi:hypothetical protein